MTSIDRVDPSQVYARHDPSVDPPTIAFGLDLERGMDEGDVVLFVDDGIEPARVFELHRIAGAFRLGDQVAPLRGAYASAQVAIRAGWAALDAASGDLPPIAALVDEDDPHGGSR